MSYLVLARKYRPQKFRELIGQEHISGLLEKAISSDRIAQAYLFCGPRGIGKTSCARILAKSLNCQKGPTLDPCGECSSCREIAQSNSFDVLEVDGASNRGIDEIRALRENVKFAPTYGRYKIYIVDEVHMLTMEAFNALLKTLEEPPEHAKFILATTAPNKVPATIISRCQRFDFKRISISTMIKTMADLGRKENFLIDEEALFAIAKAASGSLRDALSILDQVGSLCGPVLGSASETKDSAPAAVGILAKDIFSMLGLVETQMVFDLTDALAERDCAKGLTIFDQIIEQGKDIRQLGIDLIEHFRHLMVIKIGGKSLGGLVDYPVATKELLLIQAEKFSLLDILTAIETFVETQEMARILGSQRTPLEIAFAKLTYSGSSTVSRSTDSEVRPSALREATSPVKISSPLSNSSTPSNPSSPVFSKPVSFKSAACAPAPVLPAGSRLEQPMGSSRQDKFSPFDRLKDNKGQAVVSSLESVTASVQKTSPVITEAQTLDVFTEDSKENFSGGLDLEKIRGSWDALTFAVSRERMSVATFLQEGTPFDLKGNKLTIGFSKEAFFQKESLEEKDNLRMLERIFAEKLRTQVVLEFKIIENYKPQDHEPLIKSALDTFKGKVVSKWHKE